MYLVGAARKNHKLGVCKKSCPQDCTGVGGGLGKPILCKPVKYTSPVTNIQYVEPPIVDLILSLIAEFTMCGPKGLPV